MSRFDYVKYDETAVDIQKHCKEKCESLEASIDLLTKSPRAKALAITKLEECYAWIGKAIRDDQIERNGTADLQEARGKS